MKPRLSSLRRVEALDYTRRCGKSVGMETVLFFGLALADVALLVWGIALANRHGWMTSANLVLLTLFGLFYDNLLLALGRFIGAGALLETLSYGRFVLHALLTPLLVVWAWHATRRAGMPWARRERARTGVIGVTLALIAFELVTQVAGLNLDAELHQGVVKYSDAVPTQGPPLMAVIVAATIIASGVVLWRRLRWPWLLAGSVLLVVGSIVSALSAQDVVTNIFEFVLLLSIMATKAHQDAHRAEPARPQGAPLLERCR